jgi:hypothetical protein
VCCGGKCGSVVKEEFGYESDDIISDDKWVSAVEYSYLQMFCILWDLFVTWTILTSQS